MGYIFLQTILQDSVSRPLDSRGGSRISGKEVCMYKGVRVRFADFILFFLNIL